MISDIKQIALMSNMDVGEGKDKDVELNVEPEPFTFNKTEYENNKKFYEEREVSALRELAKYVTT